MPRPVLLLPSRRRPRDAEVAGRALCRQEEPEPRLRHEPLRRQLRLALRPVVVLLPVEQRACGVLLLLAAARVRHRRLERRVVAPEGLVRIPRQVLLVAHRDAEVAGRVRPLHIDVEPQPLRLGSDALLRRRRPLRRRRLLRRLLHVTGVRHRRVKHVVIDPETLLLVLRQEAPRRRLEDTEVAGGRLRREEECEALVLLLDVGPRGLSAPSAAPRQRVGRRPPPPRPPCRTCRW